ncbi:hypothetical protein BH11CYA1_BH11CYA1_49840 [soil metagenome]
MSDQNIMFGVFEDPEQAAAVTQGLLGLGLTHDDVSFVGTNHPEVRLVAGRLRIPEQEYAIRFGSIGALSGLIVGAVMSMPPPHIHSFQILTTMMAAVAGSVVLGYFGGMIGAVLHSNQPTLRPQVYEAVLPAGKVIVSAEIETEALRNAAFELMNSHKALEIVFLSASLQQSDSSTNLSRVITPDQALAVAA